MSLEKIYIPREFTNYQISWIYLLNIPTGHQITITTQLLHALMFSGNNSIASTRNNSIYGIPGMVPNTYISRGTRCDGGISLNKHVCRDCPGLYSRNMVLSNQKSSLVCLQCFQEGVLKKYTVITVCSRSSGLYVRGEVTFSRNPDHQGEIERYRKRPKARHSVLM